MKEKIMQQGSTFVLRGALTLLGVIVLLFCMYTIPEVYAEWGQDVPEIKYLKFPIIFGVIAAAVPIYIALFQTMKLLNFIDKNKVFSDLAVNSLKIISYCAVVVSAVFAAFLPLVYYIADKDDAPGMIIIWMIITFVPFAIAVFAGVVQRVLRNAIAIKSENDLTV